MKVIRPMSKVQHRLLRKYYFQGQDFPVEIYDPEKDTPNNTNPLNALLYREMLAKVSKPMSAELREHFKSLGWHKDEINFKDPAYYNTQNVVWWQGSWRALETFSENHLFSLTPQGLEWCESNINPETLEIIYRPSRNPFGCRGKPK